LDGKTIDFMPLNLKDLERVKPVYQTYKGWNTSTNGIQSFNDFPTEARTFLLDVQDYLGVKMTMISTGPDRSETIRL
jgi:adenylosuccinate synthase